MPPFSITLSSRAQRASKFQGTGRRLGDGSEVKPRKRTLPDATGDSDYDDTKKDGDDDSDSGMEVRRRKITKRQVVEKVDLIGDSDSDATVGPARKTRSKRSKKTKIEGLGTRDRADVKDAPETEDIGRREVEESGQRSAGVGGRAAAAENPSWPFQWITMRPMSRGGSLKNQTTFDPNDYDTLEFALDHYLKDLKEGAKRDDDEEEGKAPGKA